MKATLFIFLSLISLNLYSQDSDTLKIEEKVKQLFEGMRNSDQTIVKNLFTDNSTLSSIYRNKEGKTILKNEDIQSFITAISEPHIEKWDEQISNLKISIDDNLANAWMDYSFYIDKEFSYCGVNSFQFIKIDGVWKILSIIDTRRRSNCN